MFTKKQIAERTEYLGGSDIPAILGLSPFMTPLELWAIKTGQIEPKDISNKLQVRLGNKLEATVADLFQEETDKKIHRVNEAIVHPRYSFLRAHIDRRVIGEKAIVEIKTTSPWRLKEFDGDEMPAAFIIQTVYYMALTGADRGYVAVLFGNQDFKIRIIEKDKALEEDIIKKAILFWEEFIIPKKMPAVTKSDAETLYSLFPSADEGMEIGLGDAANKIIDNLRALKQDAKGIYGQIDKFENEIKAMLKEASIGRTDRFLISWKNQVKKSYTVKESMSRVLRISEIEHVEK